MRVFEIVNSEAKRFLASLVAQDQSERNRYQQFVRDQADGDWEKGAAMYAKLRNRSPDDIFGERQRLSRFMNTQFDFRSFDQEDWNNYWLLAQHADFDRNFQKAALKAIATHLGTGSNQYRYLYDRISCGISGTQAFGTQDICNRDE